MFNHMQRVKDCAARVTRKAAKCIVTLASLGIVLATPAIPYEMPTTPSGVWTGSGITTGSITFGTGTLNVETGSYYKTTPSGLRMTVTVDGTFPPTSSTYFLTPGNTDVTNMTPSASGTSPGPFTTIPVLPNPGSPNGVNSLWLGVSVFPCKTSVPTGTTCNNLGTVKVTFTDPLGGLVPVVQPKIQITKLGGTVGAMEIGAGLQTSSSGLALAGGGSTTLGVRNGNELFGDPNAPGTTLNVNCGVSATTTSGCGTVQVTGTTSKLDFIANAYRTTAGANAWGDGADGFFFNMTFDEDFGSLPTTYEGGGVAAANLLTDLRLGATVSAENTTTAAHANGSTNGSGLLTASPLAIAAGAAPSDTADGVVFPPLTTAMLGTTYTVTPTISGASRAGVVCGWIDFDVNGAFAPSTEGVCSSFAAGATSVPLNFTMPLTNISAGPTYARFRTTYDTAMTTSSFNGLFSSGETEDYQIQIKPAVQLIKTLVPASDTGTFNLLINGTSFANAIGDNGTTGYKSIYHTDTPDVTVATDVKTAAITGIALTETAAGSTNLADYVTNSSCVDGNNNAVTPGGTPAAPTISIPQSNGTNARQQVLACRLTNTRLPRFRIQKTTIGDFGGAFTFAQTNLASTPASISTTAVATPTPAAPTAINALTIGTAVTLTETPVAGYALTAATCTDANSAVTGNSGSIGTLSGNVLTILAGNVKAGADFTCVFTNTRATLKVQKITVGGFGGPYTFAQTNLASAPAGITTTAVSTATPAAPTAISISTMATAVTLTETPAAGYALTAVACTDANSAFTGNTGTFGTFAGNVVTIPAANVKPAANITCVVTNSKIPTVKVQKTTLGNFGGPFSFAQTNLASAPANITTTAVNTATPGAPAAINITTNGTAVTLTETPAAGYTLSTATCTDAASALTGNTGSIGTLAGTVLTIPAANVLPGADFTCVFTNIKTPTVKVLKSTLGGFGGPFSFAQTNLASAPANISTTAVATPTPAAATAINVTATATAITLTETIAPGYVLTTASCTDANSAVTGNTGSIGTLAGNVLTIPAANVVNGADFTCSFTNTKLPTIQVSKTSLGGVGGFTFTGTNGWASQTITTVTAGTAVSGAVQTLTAASTATTLTETIPAGYAMTAATCSGIGSGAATPNLAAGTITLTAPATAAGNVITCAVTNTKLPTLTLVKTITNDNGGTATLATFPLTAAGPVTITGTSGTASVTSQLVPVGTYALSETTSPAYAASAWSCTAGTLTGANLALAAGQTATCTIINNDIAPTLTLRKTTSGGVNTFAFSGNNGFGSDSITTTVAGTPVAGVLKTLTAGNTATDITETVTSGYFLNGAPTCTGMGSGGTVTLVSGTTYRLNAAATANASNIICSFANTLATPQLAVAKSTSVTSINAAGNSINYTIAVSNPGNVTITSITVADPMGTVVCAVSGNATIASLAPAASQNCTITYVVPQSVIDNNGGGDGKIDNTATASGSYGATPVTANGSAAVNIIRNPLLNIVKTASTSAPQIAGAVITYTYRVTNAGNVTMNGIGVTDTHNGTGILVGPTNETLTTDTAPTGDSTDPAVNGTWAILAPGDVVTFTATYTVTQHDVDFLQ
jgi:uncharacterized repeat protein (TIGR01451 family)